MITEETTRTIEIEVVIANKIETNAVKAMIEEEVTIIAIDNNLTRKTKAETAEEQAWETAPTLENMVEGIKWTDADLEAYLILTNLTAVNLGMKKNKEVGQVQIRIEEVRTGINLETEIGSKTNLESTLIV